MSEITVSRVIAASPERVWEVLTDLEHAAQTLSGVTSVHLMTDGPYAVGTRWRETRTMFGRSATEEMWVAECDPLRSTEVRAESGGATYVTQFRLAPLAEGAQTELIVRFGAELSNPSTVTKVAMKLFGGIATKATGKALEQDLTDIATVAEATDT